MKSFLAKALGWTGGAITALGTSGAFGKYGIAATILGPLLVSAGVHLASNSGPAAPPVAAK